MDGIDKRHWSKVTELQCLYQNGGAVMEYLAHYDKTLNQIQLLRDHLEAVGELIANQIPPSVNFESVDNSNISEFSRFMGLYHDIGKYSDYFQEYLKDGKDSAYKNHAHISACYLFNFLTDIAAEKKIENSEIIIVIFLYYLAVKNHHLAIEIKEPLFSIRDLKELKTLEKHFIEKSKQIIKDLNNNIPSENIYKYFNIEMLESNKTNFEFIPRRIRNGKINDPKWYFFLIYIFSLLIDMDKMDSANLKPVRVKNIPHKNVTDYLNKKHPTANNMDLQEKREKARKSMVNVISNMTDEEVAKTRFYILTAPTGIGKTLSSLQSVLLLQEKVQKVEGYTPRIIVAIPFINIVEQNKIEYENVFSKDIKMVVHHRLADFTQSKKFGQEMPVDKALLETEAWDGDVILTTFVQLFQSIFTNENRPLKKINKIAGSIIILDEAQSIPEKYMSLIGATLQLIAKHYGTRFILMTATQPKLLELGDKLLEVNGYKGCIEQRINILSDYEEYFINLKRTKFVPMLDNPLTNEEFLNLFNEKWNKKDSVLIIVNTIKRSIDVFNLIRDNLKGKETKPYIFYLSTNIVPKKRRQVIRIVSKLLQRKKPVILVSTQTIEAGVDLDFHMAFRDFAPMDSLIQSAGRVNRIGGKGNYLPIYIVKFEKDNQYIYGLDKRTLTESLLSEKEEILESEYMNLTKDYYTKIAEMGISDESKEIFISMIKLQFEQVKKFELIEKIQEVFDVFVELDVKATILADAYGKIISYDGKGDFNYDLAKALGESYKDKYKGKIGIFEKKALIRLLKSKMSDYIIQIRKSKIEGNRPIDFSIRCGAESNLLWVPPGQLNEFYNRSTGFIDDTGSASLY